MQEMLMHDTPTPIVAAAFNDRVIQILRQSLPRALANADITASTLLRDDLAVDSLGMMSFVLLLEDAFDIKLSSQVAAFSQVRSVGETAMLIQQLLRPTGIKDVAGVA